MADDVTMPDGRVIRDLTADEYDATYADGEPEFGIWGGTDRDERARAVNQSSSFSSVAA